MTALWLAALIPFAQTLTNPGSAALEDFSHRVDAYVKLDRKIIAELPLKPTNSAAAISERTQELAAKLRDARKDAVQGEFFTPEIAAEFRRVIGIAMEGHRGKRVRKSLEHAEPGTSPLRVNGPYPAGLPLQSTPPTLLINLPRLPPELDYRLVGRSLALRDVQSNLVLDFLPQAIP